MAQPLEAGGDNNPASAETAAWRRVVDYLLRQRKQLTDWELRFVKTVSRYRNPPSAN